MSSTPLSLNSLPDGQLVSFFLLPPHEQIQLFLSSVCKGKRHASEKGRGAGNWRRTSGHRSASDGSNPAMGLVVARAFTPGSWRQPASGHGWGEAHAVPVISAEMEKKASGC